MRCRGREKKRTRKQRKTYGRKTRRQVKEDKNVGKERKEEVGETGDKMRTKQTKNNIRERYESGR